MKEYDLKEIFKKAASIAAQVPDNMQQIAFGRALDILLGEKPEIRKEEKPRRRKAATPQKTEKVAVDDQVKKILHEINRTKYPVMNKFDKVLDRSLYLLKITQEDLKIDGLGSTQIAKILTDKFRLKTSRQAVQQALNPEVNYVDNKKSGRVTIYRLMQPGDEYINKIIAGKKKEE